MFIIPSGLFQDPLPPEVEHLGDGSSICQTDPRGEAMSVDRSIVSLLPSNDPVIPLGPVTERTEAAPVEVAVSPTSPWIRAGVSSHAGYCDDAIAPPAPRAPDAFPTYSDIVLGTEFDPHQPLTTGSSPYSNESPALMLVRDRCEGGGAATALGQIYDDGRTVFGEEMIIRWECPAHLGAYPL